MKTLLAVLLSALTLGLFGQDIPAQKIVVATKIDGEIRIDGKLDEAAWLSAISATDFINFEPVPSESPSQRTEVKLLFDNEALYVGAFLWDNEPDKILKQFSLRDDDGSNCDQFTLFLDTYRGQQIASVFAVTAAGVQYDAQRFLGEKVDKNWDVVWDSDISFDAKGWYVEMKIPYSAIRFPDQPSQIWNINFTREIRRTREQSSWNPINPELGDQLVQLGQVSGVEDISPPLRLSFTPYVAGIVKNIWDKDANPQSDWNTEFGGGLDLKYGINQAFTLDMTLIPDFSEVQSDNAVLNLGPFEVAFDENRPFFTEGTELFNKNNLFYSRRVGGKPKFEGNVKEALLESEELQDNSTTAQLINALKLSGRTSDGLGIGFFNAVEGVTQATIKSEIGDKRKVVTSPLTNYNMVIFDQLMSNGSNVYGMNTNVWRNGQFYDANVTGTGFKFKNKDQSYEINAFGALSQLLNEEDVDLGHSYNFSVAKISGNWTGSLGANVESENYDVNDLGLLLSANERSFNSSVSYNEYGGFGNFARAGGSISTQYTRLFKPDEFADFAINFSSFLLLKSFNAFGINGRWEPIETFDFFDPRTTDFSRYLAYPVNAMISGFISTDYRKVFALDLNVGTRRWYTTEDRKNFSLSIEPRIRFNDHFNVIMSIAHESLFSDRGFVRNAEAGEIIMGDRDRNILINSVNANYIFNANIGLALRIRHYWSTVEYLNYYELNEDSQLISTSYTGLNDDGFSLDNVSQSFFNLDCVLRWRFAPGSDLLFTWKTAISPTDDAVQDNYWKETQSLVDVPMQNSFTLKVLYYHDWASMKTLWKKPS